MIISGRWVYGGLSLSIFAISHLLKFFLQHMLFCNQEKDIFNPLQFVDMWYHHSFSFQFQFEQDLERLGGTK